MFNSLDDDMQVQRGGGVPHYNGGDTVFIEEDADLQGKRARRFMIMLASIGVGGLVTIGLSVATLTVFSNFYVFTLRFLKLIEARLEGTDEFASFSTIFGLVVILPLISGILVILAVAFTSIITYKRGEDAARRQDAELRKNSALAKGIASFGEEFQENPKLLCLTLKTWFKLGYGFTFLLVLGQLLGFIGTLFAINSLSRAVELSASGLNAASVLELTLANVQLAMFNQCCESQSFSDQGKRMVIMTNGLWLYVELERRLDRAL